MQQVTVTLALSNIRTDGGTQPRASLDLMYVADLAQSIENGASIPPITVFYDGTDYWLADGFHRYHASQQLNQTNIHVDIKQGTRRDAVLYSVGANATHGLRRTNGDKRRSVETLLKDAEWSKWSNREIARKCAVDEWTVRKYKDELSAGVPQIDTNRLVERNGTIYTMNAANIGHTTSDIIHHTTTLEDTFPGWKLTREVPNEDTATRHKESIESNKQEDAIEDIEEMTEEDRYHLACDTGTLDYYYDDLRRDAILRDKEERTTAKSATLAALQSSESNEWYTPTSYVDAARELMGCIDVDPASCDLANQTIKAARYYTKEDNGLMQSWQGKVWLNPPYGVDSGISNQEVWSHQLIERYKAGLVSEAVLLVNANTEAKWFQPLYEYLICFTNHRIRFYNIDGISSQPTQGNALIYLGNNKQRFVEIFSQFGVVVRSVKTNAI